MRYTISIFVLLFFHGSVFSQENTSPGFIDICLGLKERVTPIYVKQLPYSVLVGNIDVLEQPDMHLSGPGILCAENIHLYNNWTLSLSQSVRYDYIYQRLPLETPTPADFKYSIGRKIIFDFYAELSKSIPSGRRTYFNLFAGAAVCGLNSDYNETLRIYRTATNYADYITKKDFIFPAITTGVGWQWKKLYSELKLGYCWNNPTIWRTAFIFPELSCQYNIFSVGGTKKK